MRRFQSPELLLIVTMVTRIRDVVGRSEAYRSRHQSAWYVEGRGAMSYLSCLFLKDQKLVDRTLHVGLNNQSAFEPAQCYQASPTLASCSASGISLSASLEKSFSGFIRPPSDMMTNVGRLGVKVINQAESRNLIEGRKVIKGKEGPEWRFGWGRMAGDGGCGHGSLTGDASSSWPKLAHVICAHRPDSVYLPLSFLNTLPSHNEPFAWIRT